VIGKMAKEIKIENVAAVEKNCSCEKWVCHHNRSSDWKFGFKCIAVHIEAEEEANILF
jgi:hypothetical protein